MENKSVPAKVRLSELVRPVSENWRLVMSDLAIECDAVLRELQDRTNQTWLVKRKRWALLVLRQSEEIERLKVHAVVLANTEGEVQRERFAAGCNAYAVRLRSTAANKLPTPVEVANDLRDLAMGLGPNASLSGAPR